MSTDRSSPRTTRAPQTRLKAGRSSPARRAVLLLAAIATMLFAIMITLPRGGTEHAGRRPSAGRQPAPTAEPDAVVTEPRSPREPWESAPQAAPRPAPSAPLSPAPEVQPFPLALPQAAAAATLYVVIDDAGYSLRELEPFLAFPEPITISVLPHLRRSADAAERSRAAGKDVMLHLPMEASNGADPGPGAITVDLDDSAIRERVVAAFESVPTAVGVNNHMGSRATADRRVMDVVASVLRQNGGWILDSRTTAQTVARAAAESAGIPFVERHVFLDNQRTHDYIRAALLDGVQLANQRGYAVMIGHVMVPELAEVLMEMYPAILASGFTFGYLSDLMADLVVYERSGN